MSTLGSSKKLLQWMTYFNKAPENADYPSLDNTFAAEVPPQVDVLRGPIWNPSATASRPWTSTI